MRSMVLSSRSLHDAQSWTACVGRSGGRCARSGPLRVCPKSSWANAPRRHVPGAAGHRRNADAKRLFDKGEEVAVGPRPDASAVAFGADGRRVTENRSEDLAVV